MSSNSIVGQINSYLSLLNEQQKLEVLVVVKAIVQGEQSQDHWSDPGFVEEMDSRFADYNSGGVKMITLEEVEERLNSTLSNRGKQ